MCACWNRRSLYPGTMITAHQVLQSSCRYPLVLRFPKVTKQNDPAAPAHLCASDVIVHCSSLVRRSGSSTFVPESRLRALCVAGPDSPSPHSSSLSASSSELVLVNGPCELVEVVLVDGPWVLILTGEEVLVMEAECLKKFQVRFVVLHRLRLSPWAYASSHLARHLASALRL